MSAFRQEESPSTRRKLEARPDNLQHDDAQLDLNNAEATAAFT